MLIKAAVAGFVVGGVMIVGGGVASAEAHTPLNSGLCIAHGIKDPGFFGAGSGQPSAHDANGDLHVARVPGAVNAIRCA